MDYHGFLLCADGNTFTLINSHTSSTLSFSQHDIASKVVLKHEDKYEWHGIFTAEKARNQFPGSWHTALPEEPLIASPKSDMPMLKLTTWQQIALTGLLSTWQSNGDYLGCGEFNFCDLIAMHRGWLPLEVEEEMSVTMHGKGYKIIRTK